MLIPSFIKRIFSTLWYHKWKSIFGAIGLVIIIMIVSALMSPAKQEYLSEVAERGDLVQTVEAVGTVISDKDLDLQFRSAGIVAQVYVKEGDTVKAGQRLASLRAGDLSANVAAAVARAKQAEANLNALLEGTRPEEIAIAEAQLLNRRSSLETAKATLKTAEAELIALRQESDTATAGQVSLAASTANQQLTSAEQALGSIADVYGNIDVMEAVNQTVKGSYDSMRAQETAARQNVIALRSRPAPVGYEQSLQYMEEVRAAIQQATSALTSAYDIMAGLPEIFNFTNLDRETHKTTLAAKRSASQTALANVDAWMTSAKDASAAYDTRITTEEGIRNKAQSDIATYETSIRIDEANLALKRAGARQSDIDAARASWDAARAEVARASASVSDTVITAPTPGRITKVDLKVGEFTPTGPAITMIGDSPYRIETFVSEIDIPKILHTQTGSVELDAFPGVDYPLTVTEIDLSSTDKDGVSKYRVKLDFTKVFEEIKIGMTGDTEIVTGMRPDVVTIPRRAVLERDNGELYVRILKEDGTAEEREVVIGMEGGSGDVEVISGVEEGETVVVLVKE